VLSIALAHQVSVFQPISTASTSITITTDVSTIIVPTTHRNPPRGFCWTDILALNMAHNSATCEKQDPGHCTYETQQNKSGGSTTVCQPR
jgi:hypothetical protein